MSTIFISHSSKDLAVAQTICAALESRGLKCWIAGRDVGAGDNFQEAIVTAIRTAKVMVLVFSDNANNSTEIKKELALASQNKVAVIPARVEDVVPAAALAYELATRQWINLFNDWESEIETLCDRIKRIVPTPSATAAPQPGTHEPAQPVTGPTLPPAIPATPAKAKAARVAPLWLAVTILLMGLARLGLSSIFVAFVTRNRDWQLTSYLLTGDMLAGGLLIVVAGILLMLAARWASAAATAVCIVALLHDAVWLGVWYAVHSAAGAEAVIFHFGPIGISAIACAGVLAMQAWRRTAWFRADLGPRRPVTVFSH
ncbi:MAG: toll/interleukin-1 receptor domain-containing protein [Xanthobacteraceae bacterium]|nr:toll/interleukin-1 receptor domain-containing protein [Xanthobacteraceae bacterium]